MSPDDLPSRGRGVRLLYGGAVAYWIGLAAAALYQPVSLYARLKRSGAQHASLLFSDGPSVQVLLDKRALYTGSVTMAELALWLAVPPLLMWVAWLASTRRRKPSLPAASSANALPAAQASPIPVRGKEGVRVERPTNGNAID